ncbi:hypothetical protein BHE74_00058608 [Ensete ventricosum]|nr:hypothetical protein BHE74_00058608 [Ensete ventricosum]
MLEMVCNHRSLAATQSNGAMDAVNWEGSHRRLFLSYKLPSAPPNLNFILSHRSNLSLLFQPSWAGLLAARRLTPTKERGPRKKTSASSPTLTLTAKDAGDLSQKPQSCRLRWINYLRPDLKRGNFTEEEDELIINLHSLLGNKLPGRTDNEIKNYWNTHIRRKLLGRGLDPQTHRPIGGDSQSTASCEQHACSGVTMDQGRRRCPDLNLHLDLTMSVPYASPRSSTSSEVLTAPAEAEAEATTPASVLPHARTICFCYHLGFRSSQVCSCQTSSTAPVLGRREPNHSSRASSSARHQSC